MQKEINKWTCHWDEEDGWRVYGDGARSGMTVVLASEYEKLDKELETARRVREKLTEQRNRFADCCDRLMPFDEAIQPFDAEIAAIERGKT